MSATLSPDRTEEATAQDEELLSLLEEIANVPHCEASHKRVKKNPPIELPDCSHAVVAMFHIECAGRPGIKVCQNIVDYVQACYELPPSRSKCTRCFRNTRDCWVISPLPSVP